MKTSSIHDIQKELKTLSLKQVQEVCLRIAKYKKENKELLAYLLFEAHDEKMYIETIKKEMDSLFTAINKTTAYTTKKGLQKSVRLLNRYIKYSESKTTEIELRIYFCKKIKTARIPLNENKIINNLYERELKKINLVISKLHEDLKYDYDQELITLLG
ncbi:MAG: hypothetical protein ABI315_15750 [Bacteroidia bacterium]